jgi:25S rRNA (uracil2843-N3)-methyltransferase
MTHTDRKGPGIARPKHPKKIHHPPSRPSTSTASTTPLTTPLPIEELVLRSISSALEKTLRNSALPTIIQNIKHLLYEKKFLEVFEDETVLEAYASRWVPSRALAFREIMGESEYVVRLLEGRKAGARSQGDVKGKGKGKEDEEEQGVQAASPRNRVVCLGGGAGSELLALVALVSAENEWTEFPKPVDQTGSKDDPDDSEDEDDSDKTDKAKRTVFPPCDIHMVDIGPYAPVVNKFTTSLRSTLPSADFTESFHQTDILSSDSDVLADLLEPASDLANPPLVTLFYTLSELFLQSRPATIIFLDKLSRLAPKGTLFLIVDSANEEASALGVGKSGRSYSLGDVLDGLLCALKPAPDGGEGPPKPRWKKLEGVDSRWFRLKAGLQEKYPVKLENSRYWSRLYRKE